MAETSYYYDLDTGDVYTRQTGTDVKEAQSFTKTPYKITVPLRRRRGSRSSSSRQVDELNKQLQKNQGANIKEVETPAQVPEPKQERVEVAPYQPPTIRDIPQYFVTNIRQDPSEAIVGSTNIAVGQARRGIRGFIDRITGKQRRTNIEVRQAQQVSLGIRQEATSLGQGTSITRQETYSDEEVKKLAEEGKISIDVAVNELFKRKGEEYNKKKSDYLEKESDRLLSGAKEDFNKRYNEYKKEVESGKIPADIANQRLESERTRINQKVQEDINRKAIEYDEDNKAKFESQAFREIDKFRDKAKLKETLELAPLTVVAGAATGGTLSATGVATGTGITATAIKAAGAGTLAYTGAKTGEYFVESYKKGTLTGEKIAATLLPFALFTTGAVIGAGAVGKVKAGTSAEELRLKTALETSKVKRTKLKGITSEKSIDALAISESEKAQLKVQVRSGNRISYSEYKIIGSNSELNKIIKQNFPKQKIQFIEVVDNQGRVSNRIGVGQIKLYGQENVFSEQYIGYGKSFPIDQSTSLTETIGIKGRVSPSSPKTVYNIDKTLDLTKSKVNFYDNKLFKVVSSETKTFKTPTKTFQEITSKDINSILKSTEYGKIPTSTSNSLEVQRLRSLDIKVTDKPNVNIVDVNKFYELTGGKSESIKIPTPVDYTKSISNSFKPFPSEQTKIPTNQGVINQKQINSILKSEPKLEYQGLTAKDFSSQIKESIESIYSGTGKYERFSPTELLIPKSTNIEQVKVTSFGDNLFKELEGINKKDIAFESRIGDLGVMDSNALNNLTGARSGNRNKNRERTALSNINLGLNIPKEDSKIDNVLKNMPSSAISQKQIQKQIQQLNQINERSFNYNPNINLSNISPFPEPFGFNIKLPKQEGTKKKKVKGKKKTKGIESKYTASLGAAALQRTPTKLTKKEFDALQKAQFTGLETRPIVEIIKEQEKPKKVKKVNF